MTQLIVLVNSAELTGTADYQLCARSNYSQTLFTNTGKVRPVYLTNHKIVSTFYVYRATNSNRYTILRSLFQISLLGGSNHRRLVGYPCDADCPYDCVLWAISEGDSHFGTKRSNPSHCWEYRCCRTILLQ